MRTKLGSSASPANPDLNHPATHTQEIHPFAALFYHAGFCAVAPQTAITCTLVAMTFLRYWPSEKTPPVLRRGAHIHKRPRTYLATRRRCASR